MPVISVIVPVYRVEKYLADCVDSILAQTFTDFELILVDDGSPDHCGAICDEYAQKDSRIRVIHQENQGLSGARNSGIDVAQGEFITFIDSDDLVSPVYIELLYSGVVTHDADISCCKMISFNDGENTSSYSGLPNSIDTRCFSGREAVLSVYNGTGEVGIWACGKLYRRYLFRKHRFPVGKIHEDQAVVPVVLYEAKCVVSINSSQYYYRTRPGSITQNAFKAARFDNVEAISSCAVFFEKEKDYELAVVARRVMKKVNALLVVLALSENADHEIPRVYRLSRIKAIYYLYRYAPDNTYSWYMSKLYPHRTTVHAYVLSIRRKIRRFLGK